MTENSGTPGRAARRGAFATLAALAAGLASVTYGQMPASASVSCPAATPPRPAPALAAVQFVGPRHGWAAGAGRILATSDGGRTWSRQYDGPAALDQVDFVDREHGWAAGGNRLLRTTDGGARWTALARPCSSELTSVHFVSPALGYAIVVSAPGGPRGGLSALAGAGDGTGDGALERTTNGGVTWAPVPGAHRHPRSACFANAADGYLGTPGHIWRSTDGGRSWTLALREPTPPSGSTPRTRDTPEIECAGPAAAWVLFAGAGAAMGHAPYLAYTSQDGHDWHALFEERYTESGLRPGLKLPEGPGSYPGPFSAISADSAAFVGYTPPVGYGIAPLELVSGDGSRLSRKGTVTSISKPVAAAFVSSAQGWVVGENLRTRAFSIEMTANSGRGWTTQYTTR